MLCHTALARQAAPAAGLGLLFGPVLVGCCPLVRSYRVGTSRPLALLGCCHGLTVTHINTWPGVGQGPCMQHTCVHSAMRTGTHASVGVGGCRWVSRTRLCVCGTPHGATCFYIAPGCAWCKITRVCLRCHTPARPPARVSVPAMALILYDACPECRHSCRR